MSHIVLGQRTSCGIFAAAKMCLCAAHPWAARLAALGAAKRFVQRLQELTQPTGAAGAAAEVPYPTPTPAGAPAGAAGEPAVCLQGEAVAWLAKLVPGADFAHTLQLHGCHAPLQGCSCKPDPRVCI